LALVFTDFPPVRLLERPETGEIQGRREFFNPKNSVRRMLWQ
jgi:hypothetical protein